VSSFWRIEKSYCLMFRVNSPGKAVKYLPCPLTQLKHHSRFGFLTESLYDSRTFDLLYDMMRHDMIRYDMTWYDVIWYDMTWHDTMWYDTIWHDMIRCDMIRYDMIWYDIWYDMTWHMIYLLTAVGLTPGGSSTVHKTKQWNIIHRTEYTSQLEHINITISLHNITIRIHNLQSIQNTTKYTIEL
jgi:hypothetical protein